MMYSIPLSCQQYEIIPARTPQKHVHIPQVYLNAIKNGGTLTSMIPPSGASPWQHMPFVVEAVKRDLREKKLMGDLQRNSGGLVKPPAETITEVLLDQGANPNVADDQGILPLVYAADDGDVKLVDTLLKNKAAVKSFKIYNPGYDALRYAIKRQNNDVVDTLINCKVDPNWDGDKGSLFAYAAFYNNSPAVKKLLLARANIDGRDKYGSSALMYAYKNALEADEPDTFTDSSAIIQLLQQHKAHPLLFNKHGDTIFSFAYTQSVREAQEEYVLEWADANGYTLNEEGFSRGNTNPKLALTVIAPSDNVSCISVDKFVKNYQRTRTPDFYQNIHHVFGPLYYTSQYLIGELLKYYIFHGNAAQGRTIENIKLLLPIWSTANHHNAKLFFNMLVHSINDEEKSKAEVLHEHLSSSPHGSQLLEKIKEILFAYSTCLTWLVKKELDKAPVHLDDVSYVSENEDEKIRRASVTD